MQVRLHQFAITGIFPVFGGPIQIIVPRPYPPLRSRERFSEGSQLLVFASIRGESGFPVMVVRFNGRRDRKAVR